MTTIQQAIRLLRKEGYTVVPPTGVGYRRVSEPAEDPFEDPRHPATGRITININANGDQK